MQSVCARTVLVLIAAAVTLASAAAGPQAPDDKPFAATPYFAFYSDFAINLNDALIAVGVARRAKRTELFQSGAETLCFDALPAADAWLGGRAKRWLQIVSQKT